MSKWGEDIAVGRIVAVVYREFGIRVVDSEDE